MAFHSRHGRSSLRTPPANRARHRCRPDPEALEERIALTVDGYSALLVFTQNGGTYTVRAAFVGNPSGPIDEDVNGTLSVKITEFGVGVQDFPVNFSVEDGPDSTIPATIGPFVNDFPVNSKTLHTIN